MSVCVYETKEEQVIWECGREKREKEIETEIERQRQRDREQESVCMCERETKEERTSVKRVCER